MRVLWDILSRVALALLMALVGFLLTQQWWVSVIILALNVLAFFCTDRGLNRAVQNRLRMQKKYPVRYLPDRVVELGSQKAVFPGRKTRDLLLECISMRTYRAMGKKHGGAAEEFYAKVNAGMFSAQVLVVTDKAVSSQKEETVCILRCDAVEFPVPQEPYESIHVGDLLVGFSVEGFDGPVQVYRPDMTSTWHTLLWSKSMDHIFRR